MSFSNLLHRANLNVIDQFIMTGAEQLEDFSEKTYLQRIHDECHILSEYFEKNFPEQHEEILNKIFKYINVTEEIYFEIGFIAGAKLAFQIDKRLADLSE